MYHVEERDESLKSAMTYESGVELEAEESRLQKTEMDLVCDVTLQRNMWHENWLNWVINIYREVRFFLKEIWNIYYVAWMILLFVANFRKSKLGHSLRVCMCGGVLQKSTMFVVFPISTSYDCIMCLSDLFFMIIVYWDQMHAEFLVTTASTIKFQY